MKRSEVYTGNKGGECNAAERLAHCLRVEWTCPYCGCDLTHAKSVHIDHVLAQVWGGKKDDKNLLACCGSCNSSKQHKPLTEFATRRGDAEMKRRVRRLLKRRVPVERAKTILGVK